MDEIWAIVLAAGESKRMKVPKMLLPFNGVPMIEKVLKNVLSSNVFCTLVVLGSFRHEITGIIERMPVKYCYNEDYAKGMLSSVQCGFRNMPENFGAAIVFQGDQPFIEADVINSVIDSYRQTGKGIIIPVYRKKRGHPLLVDKKYVSSIMGLPDKKGLRALSEIYSDDVFETSVNSPGILKDFDTKQDYLTEINK